MLALKQLLFGVLGWLLRRLFGDVVPLTGGFRAPAAFVPDAKFARILLRRYERDEARLIRRHLDPALDTVELGMGVGYVSRRICLALDADRTFAGLEAIPGYAALAASNVDTGLSDWPTVVTTHGALVGPNFAAPSVGFAVDDGNFHASGLALGTDRVGVEVPAVTLADVLERADIRGEFQLVADIEGGEQAFVWEQPDALTGCVRAIIEFHPMTVAGRSVPVCESRQQMQRLGFRELEFSRGVGVYARTA